VSDEASTAGVKAAQERSGISLRSRYRGCLLGLAAGDALGTTVEFTRPGGFTPLTDMVGGGPFHLRAGQWTDDTSMALCLADSLVARKGSDPKDQAERYLRWYREGHRSATGSCFDIGGTTRAALDRFEETGNPFSGPSDPRSAGNGSLMRLAPVPMAFAASPPHDFLEAVAASSRVTHGAVEAVDACLYYGGLILGALLGETKERLLSPLYFPVPGMWTTLAERGGWAPAPAVAEVGNGSFRRKDPPAIRGLGYVIPSMEAALWAFHRSSSFEEGALLAVNLGEDADTTGAIYGQLAGAFYGEEAIPERWRRVVHLGTGIGALAEALLEGAGLAPSGEGILPAAGGHALDPEAVRRVLEGRLAGGTAPAAPPRFVPVNGKGTASPPCST
jgi:ADP-ribosylglycohydrolase